ncbi:hypothetical protein B296_00036764 [Ensete ventricosum]|uniref:Plastocyanin-like domain-containing protein n=1 Tax=Ensete ventricosum TaxID=4639 RepID=A0A426Y8D7_ENSVE|nr:hypothetical protein B296_00036764 [Ensete ventricosum]
MVVPCFAGDPYAYFDWDVSFITAAPLGVKQQVLSSVSSRLLLHSKSQLMLVSRIPSISIDWYWAICAGWWQVIGIDGQFPGPVVNVTTNWNVVVNVLNDLDEPLLITWYSFVFYLRHYRVFQVKDQIGSFFYFPSVDFQRAAGGYGGFIINNRDVIAVPFDKPHGDITLFIGDWYNKDYKARRLKPSRRLHQKQRVPDEAIPPCVGSQTGPRQREGSRDARRHSSPQDSFICFGHTSNLRVTGADASPAWNCLMQTLLWHYPTCFKTGVLPKNLYYKQRTNLLHHYAGSTLENMKGQPASQTVEAKLKAITISHLTKLPGLILSNFIEVQQGKSVVAHGYTTNLHKL